MFKYFENRRIKKQEIETALRLKQEAENKRIEEERNRKILMDSSVPWCKLIGEPFDLESKKKHDASERYDYNPAFIKSLHDQGYEGDNDTDLIYNWELDTETKRIQKLIEREREKAKASDEPWIEITGERYNEDTKEVEMNLDWNNAFVKMLRENGYSGHGDSEIVNRWFKSVSDSISADIHKERYDA